MFVCSDCCVLSCRGLCDGLITRPEESYRLWRVVVCDQETSKNEEAKTRYRVVENTTTKGCNARKTNNNTPFLSNRKLNKILYNVKLMPVTKWCRSSLQRREFKRKFEKFVGLEFCIKFYLSFLYRFMCLPYIALVPSYKGENIYIKGPTKF
jgi:hypothetical protein